MTTTLTITSKGQTTIPVEIRRKLGVVNGGVLNVEINDYTGEITIYRPMDIEELAAELTSYIKPGHKPIENVDEYYQKYREIT